MLKSQKQIKKQLPNIKLPQLRAKTQKNIITRPSSSNKVSQLHKKLLNKLDDYDNITHIKNKKKSKQDYQIKTNLTGLQIWPSNLQQIQTNTLSNQIKQQVTNKLKQVNKNKITVHAQKQNQVVKLKQQQSQTIMTQNQMNQIYKIYANQQNFGYETSKQQFTQMQATLDTTQKQIQQLQNSMSNLIKKIGYEFTILE